MRAIMLPIATSIIQVISEIGMGNTRISSAFDSFLEALGSTILEEASKLYEQLLKEQVDTIITDYVCDKNLSMLLTTPHHK
jgi:hypothetical protein